MNHFLFSTLLFFFFDNNLLITCENRLIVARWEYCSLASRAIKGVRQEIVIAGNHCRYIFHTPGIRYMHHL